MCRGSPNQDRTPRTRFFGPRDTRVVRGCAVRDPMVKLIAFAVLAGEEEPRWRGLADGVQSLLVLLEQVVVGVGADHGRGPGRRPVRGVPHARVVLRGLTEGDVV